MPTSTRKTADHLKKGYNEKNPTQPQGSFKPDGLEQGNSKKVLTNAEKLHKKNIANKKGLD